MSTGINLVCDGGSDLLLIVGDEVNFSHIKFALEKGLGLFQIFNLLVSLTPDQYRQNQAEFDRLGFSIAGTTQGKPGEVRFTLRKLVRRSGDGGPVALRGPSTITITQRPDAQ